MALTPPITIGELTDVPAPGSQIAAQWTQEVSSRVVQRFPTKAALVAWAAPIGARAVQLDNGVEWRRMAGGWSQVTPWTGHASGIEWQAVDLSQVILATVGIPADPGPRIATVTCNVRIDLTLMATANLYILVDGVAVVAGSTTRYDSSSIGAPSWQIRHLTLAATDVNIPTGRVVNVSTRIDPVAAFTVATFANSLSNRVDVLVTPKGY